jgi:phage gp37-like protein
MNYTIKQIEDAILNALKNSSEIQNLNVGKIETFTGDYKEIPEIVMKYPFILVNYVEETWDPKTQKEFDRELRFSILVGARTLKGVEHEKRKEGGVYDIIEAVYTTLAGKNLGLDISPFEVIFGRALIVEKGLFVYGIDIKTKFEKEVT